MSFAQYRVSRQIAKDRRRLYARIASMPHSTVRDELIAVAQRYEAPETSSLRPPLAQLYMRWWKGIIGSVRGPVSGPVRDHRG